MRRNRAAAALATVLATMAILAPRPALAESDKAGKLELGLLGGFAFSRITGSTLYEAGWSDNSLSLVNERTSITMYPGIGFSAGAYLTYYVGRTFGLQLMAGAMHAAADSTSIFNLHWTWVSGKSEEMEQGWDRLGSVTTLPLSLNLAARIGSGKVEGSFSGGLTLFRNTFKADSLFGFGVTRIDSAIVDQNTVVTQFIDGLDVKLRIPSTSWTAFGVNLGGGLNMAVNEGLSLKLEARYYFCPEKTLTWEFIYGSYNGIFFGDIKDRPFGAAEAADLARSNNKFELPVNPSFFQVSLGVVFHLGGATRD
jgi:opacity protein-like surface antigen